MTALERFERVLDDTQAVVKQVEATDLEKATPCTDWTVRMLVNHMIDVFNILAAPARGETITFTGQDAPDVVGSDPAGAFSGKASEFVAAWRTPGAIDREVKTMFGEQPGPFYLGLATADMLLHGWDLAQAIGVPYTMDEEAAAEVLSNMRGMLKPEMRGEGKAFADELLIHQSASVHERLLAFSGRNPRAS